MPGPGGGSHSGGGFGGGGFRGGGGGFRPRPFYGGFFGPRFYGGGCLGGLFSSMISLVVMLVVLVMLVLSLFGSAFSEIGSGGQVRYDERKFQDYADGQYRAEFGTSTAYEDNILLVVLTEKDETRFEYIAWVGDHIDTRINYLFGNEQTALGAAMDTAFGTTTYRYSMDSNLASVVNIMSSRILEQNLSSPFQSSCSDLNHVQVKSHLTNKTSLPMTEETVNTALENFTRETGIPIVVVVESAETVFGKSVSVFSVVLMIFLLAVLVLIIVRLVRGRGARGNRDDFRNYDSRNNGYDPNNRYRQDNPNKW